MRSSLSNSSKSHAHKLPAIPSPPVPKISVIFPSLFKSTKSGDIYVSLESGTTAVLILNPVNPSIIIICPGGLSNTDISNE